MLRQRGIVDRGRLPAAHSVKLVKKAARLVQDEVIGDALKKALLLRAAVDTGTGRAEERALAAVKILPLRLRHGGAGVRERELHPRLQQ